MEISFNTPDILFDGFVKDNITGIKLCIDQPGIKFVNLNAPEDLQNLKLTYFHTNVLSINWILPL